MRERRYVVVQLIQPKCRSEVRQGREHCSPDVITVPECTQTLIDLRVTRNRQPTFSGGDALGRMKRKDPDVAAHGTPGCADGLRAVLDDWHTELTKGGRLGKDAVHVRHDD